MKKILGYRTFIAVLAVALVMAPEYGSGQMTSPSEAQFQGLQTIRLSTLTGQVVELTVPADIRPEDTISGTVTINDNEGTQSDWFKGAVLLIGDVVYPLAKRAVTFSIPSGDPSNVLVRLKDAAGREIAKGEVSVSYPGDPAQTDVDRQGSVTVDPDTTGHDSSTIADAPPGWKSPRIGQVGEDVRLRGDFDGIRETTMARIDSNEMEFLAESPRESFFKIPSDVEPGRSKLVLEEAGTAREFDFNAVALSLTADELTLLRGQSTMVHVTVQGLDSMDDFNGQVWLRLANLSPEIVRFGDGGGPEIVRVIDLPDVIDGTASFSERLVGLQTGAFMLHAICCDADNVSPRDWIRELWRDKLSASTTSENSNNKEALGKNAKKVKDAANNNKNWDKEGQPKSKKKFKEFINEELEDLEEAYRKEADENTKKKIQEAIDDVIEAADAAGLKLR